MIPHHPTSFLLSFSRLAEPIPDSLHNLHFKWVVKKNFINLLKKKYKE